MKLPLGALLAVLSQACVVTSGDVTVAEADAGDGAADNAAECSKVQGESVAEEWLCSEKPQPGWTPDQCVSWWAGNCVAVCGLLTGDAGFSAGGCSK